MRSRRLILTAGVLCITPIIVAVLRNGFAGWFPTNDAALTTVYVKDVFTSHTPLIGLPARYSFGSTHPYFYPGALEMYLLAVPVKCFGVTWGLLIGMGAIQTGWTITSLWLLRRRVGELLTLVGCVIIASLLWGLGSQVILDPTPVLMGSLAFFAFCISAWSVADGDHAALIPFAISANYLLLSHLEFALCVPLVAATSLGLWVGRAVLYRSKSSATDHRDRPVRQSRRTSLAIAAGITILVWIPPIIQQITAPSGNLHALLRATGSPGVHRHLITTIRVVSAPFTTWPFWGRHSLINPRFLSTGPTISVMAQGVGFVTVGIVALTAGVSAVRRRDHCALSAGVVAGAAWVAWIFSVQMSPDNTKYEPTYLQVLWPLAAFIGLALLVGIARTTPVRQALSSPSIAEKPRAVPAIVLVILATITIGNCSIANFNATTTQASIPVARQVRAAIRAHVTTGPVVVTSPGYPARTYFPVALVALQEMDIPFTVTGAWDPVVYRSFRLDHHQSVAHLTITNTPVPPTGSKQILVAQEHPILSVNVRTYVTAQVVKWYAGPPNQANGVARRVVMTQAINRSWTEHDPTRLVLALGQLTDVPVLGSSTAPIPVPGVSKAVSAAWWHDVTSQPVYVYFAKE